LEKSNLLYKRRRRQGGKTRTGKHVGGIRDENLPSHGWEKKKISSACRREGGRPRGNIGTKVTFSCRGKLKESSCQL